MSLQAPFNLKVEYLKEEVIVDHPRPEFFWQVKGNRRGDRQTAYQIILSSEPELAEREIGDLWDSGQVNQTPAAASPMMEKNC